MAGTTQKETKMVEVMLPLLDNPKAQQQEFISVNFQNYILQRGEYTKVPEEVYEAIKNSEKQTSVAYRYATEEKAIREAK